MFGSVQAFFRGHNVLFRRLFGTISGIVLSVLFICISESSYGKIYKDFDLGEHHYDIILPSVGYLLLNLFICHRFIKVKDKKFAILLFIVTLMLAIWFNVKYPPITTYTVE